jgi:hypothetical protein
VPFDDAIETIGNFSAQDAIDLIESSQGVLSHTGQLGHPLQHCEMTTRAWPVARFQGHLLESRGDTGGDLIREPDSLATQMNKGAHTMSWTDRHLIQATRDLFLGNGAYTALHELKKSGVGARLEYARPTSHTTLAAISESIKVSGIRQPLPMQQNVTQAYLAVLDHCAGGRLQLQTIFAQPSNSNLVSIKVRQANTLLFSTEFPAF